MVDRDFPSNPDHQPKHWQCFKCAIENKYPCVVTGSNIASTEIRERIKSVVAEVCCNTTGDNYTDMKSNHNFPLEKTHTNRASLEDEILKNRLEVGKEFSFPAQRALKILPLCLAQAALEGLTPIAVIEYIVHNGLYR